MASEAIPQSSADLPEISLTLGSGADDTSQAGTTPELRLVAGDDQPDVFGDEEEFRQNMPDPRPDGEVTLLLPDDEARIYKEEMVREIGFIPLTLTRVRQLNGFFYENRPKLVYTDRRFEDLVLPVEGGAPLCRVAERTYHEATWGPLAEAYAVDARNLLRRLGIGGPNPRMIELNTGLGSLKYSFGRAGFDIVATVERNPEIFDWTRENWQRLGFNGTSTKWINADAWDYVDKAVEEGVKVDIVVADPPWRGIHSKQGKLDFDVMEPDGRKIVGHLFNLADVVALKAPGSLANEAVQELGANLGAGVRSVEYLLQVGESRVVHEKMLFYIQPNITGDLIYEATASRMSLSNGY